MTRVRKYVIPIAAAVSLAVCGCGPKPPQAPKRDAHEVSSALSAVSSACGQAEEIRAFGSLGPHKGALAKDALSGGGPLRAVYRRNSKWVFQDKSVSQLVNLAVSDLQQCGLPEVAKRLKSRVR